MGSFSLAIFILRIHQRLYWPLFFANALFRRIHYPSVENICRSITFSFFCSVGKNVEEVEFHMMQRDSVALWWFYIHLTKHCIFVSDLRRYTFASASPDNIKQWKFPDGSFLQNLSGHNAIVNCLALNPDNVLVSGGMDVLRFRLVCLAFCGCTYSILLGMSCCISSFRESTRRKSLD